MTNFKLSILRNVFLNCIAVVKLFGVHNRTKNKVEKQVQGRVVEYRSMGLVNLNYLMVFMHQFHISIARISSNW